MLMPIRAMAQDDASDAPLGDVARNLRRKPASSQDVIDNDNLSQVMDQTESRHPASSVLRFLMAGGGKGFQVSAPDVTCSLAFTASAKSLLSSQYAEMELPPAELMKLQGPATIEGDALSVSVFNATQWHVSEVVVALTVVRKDGGVESSLSASWNGAPAAGTVVPLQGSEVRPERKPDVTVIYKMRAASAPFATTVFSAPLSLDVTPEQEWHWAIVQAKGYPPQYGSAGLPAAAQAGDPAPLEPPVPPAMAAPQASPVATSQNRH